MRKRKLMVIGVLLVAGSGFIFGFVMGGTNFSISGYPKFFRYKPSTPFHTGTIAEWEYDSYQSSVERFVDEAKTYVENADNDVRRIRESQQEAIDAANDAIDDFNDFVRNVRIKSSY